MSIIYKPKDGRTVNIGAWVISGSSGIEVSEPIAELEASDLLEKVGVVKEPVKEPAKVVSDTVKPTTSK